MCISACITKEKRVKVEEGRGAEGSDSACVCLILSSNLVIALKKQFQSCLEYKAAHPSANSPLVVPG